MSVSSLISEITTHVPALGTVIEGCASTSEPSVDMDAELVSVLDSSLSNAVYPLTLGEDPPRPNAVYSVFSGQPLPIDGRQLAYSNQYRVEIRDDSFANLTTIVSSIEDDLRSSSHAMQVIDRESGYDFEHDSYRYDLMIGFTTPATCGTMVTLPCCYVYEAEQSTETFETSRCYRQLVSTYYGVVILTNSTDLITLRDSVYDAIFGFEQDENHEAIRLIEGGPLDNDGGLNIWRSIYMDKEYVTPVHQV
jgi:hypothetical protein